MEPNTRSEKATISSKEVFSPDETEMMEEEEVDSSPLKRASETDPEEVLMQVQETKSSTKKIKQLSSSVAPNYQAQALQFGISPQTATFSSQFHTLQPTPTYSTYTEPFFAMKSNQPLGKNPKDLEEEYRLIEELINNENKYHALKYKQIIIDLKSKDEMKIMEAISLLSTELSMAQEENFGSFQLDFLIPELINCLQMENPEIMMHAAVSIMHILDIMPAASKFLVNSGGVEVLCQKMQNFEFIDVAESAIKALEKISYEFGLSILTTGGMEMMLTMIDFFVSPTQKLIMSIISNIFRLVNSETMLKDKILPVLPIVLSYTQHDPTRQEIMYNMISRLADRVVRVCGEEFEKKREYLEIIAQDRMAENFCIILNDLLDNFDQNKLEQIENILRTLNKFCYFSLSLCMESFNAGLIGIIDKLITILETPTGKDNQFSNLAYETISLVNSILALRATPHPLIGKIASHIGIKITENSKVNGRMEMFRDHPYILQSMLETVGTRLPGIFENNAGSLFKYLVLISFQKIIEFSEPDFLHKKLNLQLAANFISKLITSTDIMIIAVTLFIIELLVSKIPEAFIILTREGVLDYIKSLSNITEVAKLEAYSILPKRYNPMDMIRQFSTNLGRLNSSGPNEFLTNLETESQKLEAIMQQLQALKNGEPLGNLNNNNDGDEPGSGKSPKLFTTQSGTKTNSSENKLFGSQKKKEKDSDDDDDDDIIEEEEIPNEKTLFPTQPIDKVTEIRRDISIFAQELYQNMKDEIQKKGIAYTVPTTIINKLEEISLSFEQNQWNPDEFGQKHFQKYLDLVSEHGRVTNYELKSSKTLTHLLNFLFDNLLESKQPNSAEPVVENKEKESTPTYSFKKLRNRFKEEEKKNNSEGEKITVQETPVVEINENQCRTIVGRVICFLYYFKKIRSTATQETHLQEFLKNLQEMLTNSDQFSLDISRNYSEYENTLSSDMKFLSQRVKFKAQYSPPQEHKEKKLSLGALGLHKQKSVQIEEETKSPSTLETQAELYQYKDSIFKEVPALTLSVEQFGTLEVIEDYLLNKLHSKEDLHAGLFGRSRVYDYSTNFNPGVDMNDYINEKLENNDDAGSDEEMSPSEQPPEDLSNSSKKSSVNKVPVTNPKTKSPGATSLQKSMSSVRTKYESKFVKNDKKKWVDRLTGKEINFKKYFELKFYINEEEVDKNRTIYEIFSKYRAKNLKYLGNSDEVVVEYKLVNKKVDNFEFSSGQREQYKQINLLCLDPKSILQNILLRVLSLELKSNSSLRDIIRMIIVIHELVDLDKRMLSPATVFGNVLVELKAKEGFGPIISAYKEESLQFIRNDIIPKGEFVNKKISSVVDKYLNDPLTLTAGLIPDVVKEICEKAPFLLDFRSKLHYYKNGCFHISRALYYIFHENKARLKELDSARIGKIHKKKIKVSREKILENAVVNFETYGYKKALLDFEFLDEEGTGLGPTLEYYAMVASEIKNPDHNLWRGTTENTLFPSPIDPYDLKYPDPNKPKRRQSTPENKRDFEKFQLIFRCAGTMLARAIMDERVVDLPFHNTFCDIVLEKPLYLEDVARIDKDLGESLISLQEIVNKKHEIEKDPLLTPVEKSSRIKELKFKGASIDDLALTFTFPGYDEIDLIENGEDMPVTLSNLDQYVSILARYFLLETVKSQIFAFREGFDKVIPLKNLKIFENDEVEALICGGRRDEAWDQKTLEENFVPAHGYNQNSKSFKNFVKIVSEFSPEEKRAFLKFATGAERLPFGGFKNLTPKLTVVKKQPNSQHEHPDDYLPSVMTCQNYFKLPDYSSIEVMKKKLLFAMKEGQNSFSLS